MTRSEHGVGDHVGGRDPVLRREHRLGAVGRVLDVGVLGMERDGSRDGGEKNRKRGADEREAKSADSVGHGGTVWEWKLP